ncbi:MAG: hypothetical protein HQK87_07755, partial [Nitrospinae bacterium]|nr:hypothetical protein [Nitrospinota bacterium]
LLVIGGGAWQLSRILATLAGADLKQSLTVYLGSWLILLGAGIVLRLALAGLAG